MRQQTTNIKRVIRNAKALKNYKIKRKRKGARELHKGTLYYPNIRAELARLGLSVTDLSEFMGMTRQNVQNKLNGRTAINEKDMKVIQEFFIAKGGGAMTLDYLFKTTL